MVLYTRICFTFMTVCYCVYYGHGVFVTVLLPNVMLVRLTLVNKGNLLKSKVK